jgi:hypothetical protein
MRPRALALIAALAALLTAQAAVAETLNLICRVQWTRAGGAHRGGLRRLDIDLGAKTVRVSDDVGRGMTLKGEHPIVSADKDRIRLETGGGKESYVDRISGQYVFHNDKDGVTVRGPCQKVGAERPRF